MDLATVKAQLEAQREAAQAKVNKLEEAIILLDSDQAEVFIDVVFPYLNTTNITATSSGGKRPKTQMCPVCGEGPFANLGRHTAAKHPNN